MVQRPMSCAWETADKNEDIPSLCDDDVVEWVVLVAEARQSDPENHGV